MKATAGTSTLKLRRLPSSEKVPVAVVGSLLGGTSLEPVSTAWNWIVPWACAWRAQASRARMSGTFFKLAGTDDGVRTLKRLRCPAAPAPTAQAQAGFGREAGRPGWRLSRYSHTTARFRAERF